MQVSSESTMDAVKFESSVMGTFSADIFIPPNTIDFASVFDNFGRKLADSPVVLVVIIVLYVLFIIGGILAHREDREDAKRVRLSVHRPILHGDASHVHKKKIFQRLIPSECLSQHLRYTPYTQCQMNTVESEYGLMLGTKWLSLALSVKN